MSLTNPEKITTAVIALGTVFLFLNYFNKSSKIQAIVEDGPIMEDMGVNFDGENTLGHGTMILHDSVKSERQNGKQKVKIGIENLIHHKREKLYKL